MLLFLVGLVGFLGIHSLGIVSWSGRQALVARLGEGPFKGLYSILSVAFFALLVYGYGWARLEPTVVWAPPTFTRHITWTLMLPAMILLVATYAPGKIRSTVKHPMLTAVKTWAVAHLLANGMLADILLFGGFLAWAVADRIAIKRRPDAKAPAAAGWGAGDAVAIVGGVGLYLAFFFFLHTWLIGVAVR
jgi:uncharacterized membrane protein